MYHANVSLSLLLSSLSLLFHYVFSSQVLLSLFSSIEFTKASSNCFNRTWLCVSPIVNTV